MKKFEVITSENPQVYGGEPHLAIIMRDDDNSGAGKIIADIETDAGNESLAQIICKALNASTQETSFIPSFRGDNQLKLKLVIKLGALERRGQIVQGEYGQYKNGRFEGCGIGSVIFALNAITGSQWEYSDHSIFESVLGIPHVLASVYDKLFEGLPAENAKKFPVQFINAIPVGEDLSLIMPRFLLSIIADCRHYLDDKERAVVIKCQKLLIQQSLGNTVSKSRWAAMAKEIRDVSDDLARDIKVKDQYAVASYSVPDPVGRALSVLEVAIAASEVAAYDHTHAIYAARAAISRANMANSLHDSVSLIKTNERFAHNLLSILRLT